MMSRDDAFQQLFLGDRPDPAAARSALNTYSARMNVPFMVLLSPGGSRIGDTGGALPRAALRPFQELVKNASIRSEEHTSELQSLRHLVCRLLLEKKKKGRENMLWTICVVLLLLWTLGIVSC